MKEKLCESNSYARSLTFIGRSAKYVVSGTVATILLLDNSVLPLYYVVIGIWGALFSKVLKNILKQPRPMASPKRGYGMPSSHTSAIAYFTLLIYFKGPAVITNPSCLLLLNSVMVSYGVMACYWRITSHLHSTSQIAVGGLIGTTGAFLALYFENAVCFWLNECLSFYQSFFPSSLPLLFAAKLVLSFLGLIIVFFRNIKYFILSRIDNKSRDM
jgi:membrane-associated phospholipid phosphatase